MKRRLTPVERRKYVAAYVVATACAFLHRGSLLSYALAFCAGASVQYAGAMYARARRRRFFRNTHGALLFVTANDPSLADLVNLDSSFVEISPKDAK